MSAKRWFLRFAALVALLTLLPATASAVYVVILKDGTRISAREKYKIQGDQALITLTNGTVTTILASRIDPAASDKATAAGLADAVPLPGPSRPSAAQGTMTEREGASLQEVARQRKLREEQRRKEEAGKPGAAKAGAATPYAERDIAIEFYAFLESSGLPGVSTYQGATRTTLRIDVTTDKEEQIFSAMNLVAKKFQEMKGSKSNAPERIELNMKTTTGESAGSFSFDIGEVGPLLRGELSPQDFYVRNVLI